MRKKKMNEESTGKAVRNKQQFYIDNKKVTIYPCTGQDRPMVYLNAFAEEEGERVYQALHKKACPDFTLVVISGLDWNRDMSPWAAQPVFKEEAPFTGGAEAYLRLLTEEIVPEAEKKAAGGIAWRGLAGYSLAGLFAVYAMYHTDFFSRIASASGSLWFPDFKEFVFSHEMAVKPDCLYMSLGDKECRTRNPYMKTVRENTEAMEAFYREKGIKTTLQINPGNHFQDTAERMAAGILWLLRE